MAIRTEERAELREYLATAKGIAWDTCHKIYVLMDDEQMDKMRKYGYGDENDPDSLLTSEQLTPKQMSAQISRWFNDSCLLRFVQVVGRNREGNEFYHSVVPQR